MCVCIGAGAGAGLTMCFHQLLRSLLTSAFYDKWCKCKRVCRYEDLVLCARIYVHCASVCVCSSDLTGAWAKIKCKVSVCDVI